MPSTTLTRPAQPLAEPLIHTLEQDITPELNLALEHLLPAHQPEDTPSPRRSRHGNPASSSLRSSGRVLVVTEDGGLAGAVASELAGAGLAAGHAPDGRAALHRLAQEQPAAVVLDLDLHMERHGVSGDRLLRVLAGSADTRNVPVVAFSSAHFQEHRETLRRMPCGGPVALLAKPACPAAVAEHVRVALAV